MKDMQFILKSPAHLILIMEVIDGTLSVFRSRYYEKDKYKISGNPDDLDIAFYLKDCLCHVLSNDRFNELNYLSDNDLTKMLNISYEIIFEETNE